MPVPTTLASLSTTAASNSPSGGENPFPDLDDHIRAGYAFDAQNRDAIATKLNSSAVSAYMLTVLNDADADTARATLGAASLGANTFTGAQTLPGNAANALEAVPKQQAESIAAATAASAVANRFQFSQTLEIATTSGTEIDINDLPSWVKRLTVTLGGSSITTTGAIGIQLGTASGFETSGYNCIHVGIVSGSYGFGSTTGVIFRTDINGGANQLFATVVMNLHGSNRWQAAASGYRNGDGAMALSYGQIQLPAALTRLRLSASQPFDGGSVSVLCEG